MKTRNLLGIVGMALLAGACVPSVNPFFTEKDVVFDARLVGKWEAKGNTNDVATWTFEKSGDKAYKVVVTEKGNKQGLLEGHLFRMGDHLFLDLIPTDCKFAPEQADIVTAALFPGHLLLSVPKIEPNLQLAFCDYDWLEKYLEAHPEALAYHAEDKRLVLTAKTEDLQAFVKRHLTEMFQQPEEFTREPAK